MPPFPPLSEWVGTEPPDSERLAARAPVLIHFFDFAQLNSVRSLPYVIAWNRTYGEFGLLTVGIHTPRFPFSHDAETVTAGCEALGISHPVCIDSTLLAWRDYGCQGWPSFFLFSKGGALRWYHLGEGDYGDTESAIREELEAADLAPKFAPASWPDLMDPIRPSDARGAMVGLPTPELLPGGDAGVPWSASEAEPNLEVDYEGGGAWVTAAGPGELAWSLDGVDQPPVPIETPGLFALAEHPAHEAHRLTLAPGPGVELHSVSFAPGMPS